MGSSMTCKQQYCCCGNMRNCSGPEDPYPHNDQPLTMSMFSTKADLERAKHAQRLKTQRAKDPEPTKADRIRMQAEYVRLGRKLSYNTDRAVNTLLEIILDDKS